MDPNMMVFMQAYYGTGSGLSDVGNDELYGKEFDSLVCPCDDIFGILGFIMRHLSQGSDIKISYYDDNSYADT